jgi:hypothetical protein
MKSITKVMWRCLVHETEHGNFKHTKVSVQSPPIGQRERGEDC